MSLTIDGQMKIAQEHLARADNYSDRVESAMRGKLLDLCKSPQPLIGTVPGVYEARIHDSEWQVWHANSDIDAAIGAAKEYGANKKSHCAVDVDVRHKGQHEHQTFHVDVENIAIYKASLAA